MKSTILLGILLLGCTFVQANDLRVKALDVIQPVPYGTPEMKNDPISGDKVALGKSLFFDPRLSRSSLISCNTCHNLGMGGDDDQETSTGHGWQQGPRNSPTVLNAVYNTAQFWDGRAKDLMEQAKGPVQASVEMNNTPEAAVETLKSMPGYITLFQKAFPDDKDPVTFDNMARAIEAFEATLVTPDSQFDRYLRGSDSALTDNEKKGLALFLSNGCGDCHSGINMGGTDYFPFGVVEKPDAKVMGGDKGRFKVTHSEGDEYVFKSPSLRNIELTAPYFHSGKVWALRDAVHIMGSAQLGKALSESDTDLIVDFLKTTTGKQPQVTYPILPASSVKTPKPVLK
jgi:cytochrome c peroxidase